MEKVELIVNLFNFNNLRHLLTGHVAPRHTGEEENQARYRNQKWLYY